MNAHQFSSCKAALHYMLAGNARITVVSLNSGIRFTFKVRQTREGIPHFVSVLTGSDNTSDFSYLGAIFDGVTYKHGRKSNIRESAPSAKAFQWLWAALNNPIVPDQIAAACEVWHEGRCGRCARVLTVPSSLAAGLGPECQGRAA